MSDNVGKFRIVGVSPLLMKNGQTADPLNVYAKAVAEISKKRNKTEADHLELSRREFFGALYIDQNGPFIPAVNIRKGRERKTWVSVPIGGLWSEAAAHVCLYDRLTKMRG